MPVKDEFATELDNYASTTKANRATRESRRRRNLLCAGLGFGAASSAALLTGTAIEAGINYSGIQNLTMTAVPGAQGNLGIDMDGGGTDIRLFNFVAGGGSNTQAWGDGAGGARIMTVATTNAFGADAARNHASGELIGTSGSTAGPATGRAFFNGGSVNAAFVQPQFSSNTGFMGVQLGSGNFGWLRVHTDQDDHVQHTLTVVDWAYDDTGAHLLAGEGASAGPAVPEPSSALLMGLGLLSLGAVGIREKRRKAREAVAKSTDPAIVA